VGSAGFWERNRNGGNHRKAGGDFYDKKKSKHRPCGTAEEIISISVESMSLLRRARRIGEGFWGAGESVKDGICRESDRSYGFPMVRRFR